MDKLNQRESFLYCWFMRGLGKSARVIVEFASIVRKYKTVDYFNINNNKMLLGPVTSIASPPAPDDIAIIMYTSGSSGKPKVI